MFATTSAVQTPTAAAASPRHLQLIPVGSKRRQGALVSSSPVARGCIAATTSNDATDFGATPSISTPIHFTKCFKTGADAPSTGVKYTHARSKSLDECGVSSSDMHKHTKHVFANAGGLDSPLRSRRALPSLSVGAANDETLVGRPGIVYINGTKMPQDGWYQRCFGCGMWTAQSVRLGQFEVFRCKCCAREFRSRAKSMSAAAAKSLSDDRDASADAARRRGGATTSTTTTCSSEEASQTFSSSSLLTSDTATTVSTRGAAARRRSPRGVSSSSVVTSAEGVTGAEGRGGGRNSTVAAARRAMRRSVRANRWRAGEGATAAGAAVAELPPLHPTTSRRGRRIDGGGGGGGDTEMLDAVEDSSFFADSSDALHHHHQQLQYHHQQQQQRGVSTSDAEVLTSLVSKLRDFLVVNMPQNSVENSILLRRVGSTTLPSLAYS